MFPKSSFVNLFPPSSPNQQSCWAFPSSQSNKSWINERLPLNEGANPLNIFDGGLKCPPLEGLCLYFRGDLSRSSLNGLLRLNPGGGLFCGGLLFGLGWPGAGFIWFLWWNLSDIGWNSATLSWSNPCRSLLGTFLLGFPAFPLPGCRGPFLFGLINCEIAWLKGL